MATLAFTDAVITINSVNLSTFANQVSITYEGEAQDETAFGDTTRINKGGLLNWTMEVTFHQDFAVGGVDATMFSLVNTTTTVSVKPTSAATSATNPDYNGTGYIQNYQPFSNSVGELASATISILSAGTLARSVA